MGKKYNGEVLGTLRYNEGTCTETIKIHPVECGTWHLIPETIYEDQGKNVYNYVSLISFDTRQTWEVYGYMEYGTKRWVVQKNGLYLRMPDKDFESFFGKYELIEEVCMVKSD